MAAQLLVATGCSPRLVQKAPRGPIDPTPPLACTSSALYPALDTMAATLIVGGFAAVAIAGAVHQDPQVMWWGIALGVLGGAYPTYSAVHGWVATTECRDLKSEQLACVSGVEASCHALRYRGLPESDR